MLFRSLGDRSVLVAVWKVRLGRITLYLLDTDLDENAPEDETGEEASTAAALASPGADSPQEPPAMGATDAPVETFAVETQSTETIATEADATEAHETHTHETHTHESREHAEVETAPHD